MSSLPGLSSHHGVSTDALQSVVVQSRHSQFGPAEHVRPPPAPPARQGPSPVVAFLSRPRNLMLTLVMGMALVYLAVFTTDTFSLSHPHGLYRRFQDHYNTFATGPSVSLLDSSDPTWQALPASERLAILQSTIHALSIKVDSINQEIANADHGHSHHRVEDLPPAASLAQVHPDPAVSSAPPAATPAPQSAIAVGGQAQTNAQPQGQASPVAPHQIPDNLAIPAFQAPTIMRRPLPVPPPSKTSARVYTEVELDSMVTPTDRQAAIKNAMLHSWEGYEKFCWGKDEFRPISGTCMDWIGLGLTIIDSLDTLHLMGLSTQFQRAKQYVASMNIRPNQSPSLFETTIRILGGLAAAYDLTGERVFLDKEIEVAKVLSAGFNTPTGIPVGQVSLRDGTAVLPGNGQACLAELGSLQLEFFHAAHHGNNETFYKIAHNVYDKLDHAPKVYEGLYPTQIGINDVSFRSQFYTMGAMADSFYEYLIKLYLLTNRERPQYKRMWMESVRGMRRHLVAVSPSGHTYLARLQGSFKDTQMEHFACFVPGNLMLGAMHGGLNATEKAETTELAKTLMDACIAMYTDTATGISFDVANFGGKTITAAHPGWPQRPECVESLFYLWRFTKNQKYRDAGWQMFKAMELRTRVANAHVSLADANSGVHTDRMESFWLGETLKYFYLLFAEDHVIPLDQYVFNTEAHPIKVIRNFRFGDKRDWKATN